METGASTDVSNLTEPTVWRAFTRITLALERGSWETRALSIRMVARLPTQDGKLAHHCRSPLRGQPAPTRASSLPQESPFVGVVGASVRSEYGRRWLAAFQLGRHRRRNRVLIQGGCNIRRRNAPHISWVSLVERARTMHRTAVVPDHKITRRPVMAIYELRLSGMLHQILDQHTPFRNRPVQNMRGVGGQIQCLALRPRNSPHHALGYRRQRR